MSQKDVYAEWQKLCDEHEAAREAYFRAFATVNRKFVAIGRGESKTNPTDGELSEFERTWRVWEDVKQRMDRFVKARA